MMWFGFKPVMPVNVIVVLSERVSVVLPPAVTEDATPSAPYPDSRTRSFALKSLIVSTPPPPFGWKNANTFAPAPPVMSVAPVLPMIVSLPAPPAIVAALPEK